MKTKNSSLNERGIAHLGLIILIVAVLGIGVFAYMRVSNSSDTNNADTSSQTVDADASDAELEQEATEANSSSDAAVNVEETEDVVE